MAKGYFFSFEGIDGSGKSLMQQLVGKRLKEKGYSVLLTKEPGGSDLGRQIRNWLLDQSSAQLSAKEELLLFSADRARHVDLVIKPALLAGKVVLCDRYIDSTVAYQGGGRGLDKDFIERINDFATGGLKPELTFYLDLPLEVARKRQKARLDKIEQQNGDFFQAIIDSYRLLAQQYPQRIIKIDATSNITTVAEKICCQIEDYLAEAGKNHE